LPDIQLREHFYEELNFVKAEALKSNNKLILDWLRNKEGKNSWVLECVSPATTEMKKSDWWKTSMNTNIAESAHVISQKDGTRLTLISAIQIAKSLDIRSLEDQIIAQNMSIVSRHGNQSLTGRTAKNLKRHKKTEVKKAAGKMSDRSKVSRDLSNENILI
jgi:hypothetical protein